MSVLFQTACRHLVFRATACRIVHVNTRIPAPFIIRALPLRTYSSAALPHSVTVQENVRSSRPLFRAVSFYCLTPLDHETVTALRTTIEKQLRSMGVVGRIYLAPKDGIGGINCQIAVPVHLLPAVKAFFDGLPELVRPGQRIMYTESLEDMEQPCFRKLRVLVKKNLVAVNKRIETQSASVDDPSRSLDPAKWHEELSQQGDHAIVVDMRNHYEYDIGRFERAIKMDVDTFREGLEELEKLARREPEKEIYMYCTGGIRCDVASLYLQQRGIHNTKMLKGGITAYGYYIRSRNERSLFRGKNFTFDDRRGERVTDDVLARCYHCGAPCDHLRNCANTKCHLLFIQCEACRAKTQTCSAFCSDVLAGTKQWTLEYDYHRQIRPQ